WGNGSVREADEETDHPPSVPDTVTVPGARRSPGQTEVHMWFILAGGFPMIVILVVGAIALVGAVRFAITPIAGRLPYLGALALAVAATSFAGTCADLLTVSVKVPANPEMATSDNLPIVLLVGLG